MTWVKRILKVLAALLALAALVVLGLFIYIQLAYNVDFPNTPKPAITASKDPTVIARGEYLVHAVAHCSTCHGDPVITPDIATGIGGLSDGEVARTIRHGVDRRGKLSPIMSFAVGNMSMSRRA